MKLNTDKWHLLILGRNSNKHVTLNIGDSVIENTDEEKLLGVVIDKKLTFDAHISKLFKKAGSKLFALACIAGYMDTNKNLIDSFCNQPVLILSISLNFYSRHLTIELIEYMKKP